MSKVQTIWEKASTAVLTSPKFLKRGSKVIVLPQTVPKEVEVEGRYGKHKMFIVETRDYGLIYVSKLQLVKIVEAFNGDYSSGVTVEL